MPEPKIVLRMRPTAEAARHLLDHGLDKLHANAAVGALTLVVEDLIAEVSAAEARGRQQMIDALRVVPAPLIGASVPDGPQVVAGRDRIVIRSAADVLIAHSRTDIRGCHCGWAKLGHSHAQHVAEELANWLESLPTEPRS